MDKAVVLAGAALAVAVGFSARNKRREREDRLAALPALKVGGAERARVRARVCVCVSVRVCVCGRAP
jgi:hypothetical protein